MNEHLIYGQPTLGRRVGAFIVDYFIITLLGMSPFMFLSNFGDMRTFYTNFPITMAIALSGILLKDVFGRSLGKLIFSIRIAHGDAADLHVTAGQRILRNIPLLFWPVELIMTFRDPYNRRLGDKWAHTLIAAETRKRKLPVMLIAAVGGAVFFLFIFFGVTGIIRSDDSYKTAIEFIQSQEEIDSAVGGIESFGVLPSGSLQYVNDSGAADLRITVIGEDATITVKVHLTKQPGEDWVVNDFDY